MKFPGLFITGTDTGVGKTAVTAALAFGLRRAGLPIRVRKPIATGADGIAYDTRQLLAAAGLDESLASQVTPWTYAIPAAPPVAARLAGQPLPNLEALTAATAPGNLEEFLLIEGVGGLLCPLTERETVADWVSRLGLSLVVVARRGLGTLNHTLLTLEVADRRGLPVVGVVLNEVEPIIGPADRTNPEELRRLGVNVLAVMQHRPGGPAVNDAWKDLADVNWQRLGRSGS